MVLRPRPVLNCIDPVTRTRALSCFSTGRDFDTCHAGTPARLSNGGIFESARCRLGAGGQRDERRGRAWSGPSFFCGTQLLERRTLRSSLFPSFLFPFLEERLRDDHSLGGPGERVASPAKRAWPILLGGSPHFPTQSKGSLVFNRESFGALGELETLSALARSLAAAPIARRRAPSGVANIHTAPPPDCDSRGAPVRGACHSTGANVVTALGAATTMALGLENGHPSVVARNIRK